MRHRFFSIDNHTTGNPPGPGHCRWPQLPHLPIFRHRGLFLRDHDWIRTALMFKARGLPATAPSCWQESQIRPDRMIASSAPMQG
ncbi:MAG: proline racemase family protein [Paracoccus sp. (in: a-proteobacteria)]|uniref:proline racemase family protein n=1 Tax=Paracoccus sp. TaxID=267 RepID=UPI0026E021D2|nr:proline racemase family protein [Paracoccus sp. (in: a-proteobacteria)]MDO5612548.1 proline racemase family protein [Paracoccus sp. (in: a-proteobacteria)]